MVFIGRSAEMATLEAEYQRSSGFVVIYGRRRVGKTTLIKEFIKDKSALYFLATVEVESQNMQRFVGGLAAFTGQDFLKQAAFHDWEAILKIFADYRPERKKILVIDEFQYLVQVNPAFPSLFQRIWDEYLKDRNIMVILCGSLISMMTTHVLSYSSPLYGRRTAQIRLQQLPFYEVQKHYSDKPFSDIVEIYAVTGGVPKYFEFFDNDLSLFRNIEINILQKSGFLYEEPIFLLEKEVREPVNYFSILKTISCGKHKLSEMAGSLEQKSNALSPYLSTLVELNLIEKRLPVTEKDLDKSRKGLYYISDNFINFWFNYVYPFRGELELDNQQTVLDELKRSFRNFYVSIVYEEICKSIFAKLCLDQAIPFSPSRIGSYWNGNNSIQIDVVALDNHNRRIFAAECKYWERSPVTCDVYQDLQRKCQNPDFLGYDIVYGLFSKTGFDQRLLDIAAKNHQLILINESKLI